MGRFMILKANEDRSEFVKLDQSKVDMPDILAEMLDKGYFAPSSKFVSGEIINSGTIKKSQITEDFQLAALACGEKEGIFALFPRPDEKTEFYTVGVRSGRPLERIVLEAGLDRKTYKKELESLAERHKGVKDLVYAVEAGVEVQPAPTIYLNVDGKDQIQEEFGKSYTKKQNKLDTLIASFTAHADAGLVEEYAGKVFVVISGQMGSDDHFWVGKPMRDKETFKKLAAHLHILDATEDQILVQVRKETTPELINALSAEQNFMLKLSEITI